MPGVCFDWNGILQQLNSRFAEAATSTLILFEEVDVLFDDDKVRNVIELLYHHYDAAHRRAFGRPSTLSAKHPSDQSY